MRITALATVLYLTVSGVLAEPPQEQQIFANPASGKGTSLAKLETRVPEVRFEGVPAEQVLDWLSERVDLNVWVRWQTLEAIGIERDKPITLSARNLRLSQVLWMGLGELGGPDVRLGYAVADDVLVISTRDDLGRDLVLETYDVRDLLLSIPDFTGGPTLSLQSAGGGTGVFDSAAEEAPTESVRDDESQRLVDLITTTVEPDSWVLSGGEGTITTWHGILVVRNSRYVHQQLRTTLDAVRGRR